MSSTKQKLLLILTLLSSCFMTTSCDKPLQKKRTYNLKPPFDIETVRKNFEKPYTKKFKCKRPPEPMADLFFESMYDKSSKNASIIDPAAYDRYKKAIKPAQKLEQGLATTANYYLKSNPPRPEIAACVMSWITIWADAKGFLGKNNKTGEFIRKWLLASISLAYMQVRDDPYIPPDIHEKAQTWIRNIATRTIKDFSKHPDITSRNNNHMYWAAWGVMTAGLALDDKEMFDWALYEAKIGIEAIEENGTLPLEIARGPKAYSYHHFAAIPLFMMAQAAHMNGTNLFPRNNEGLKRLAHVILDNMDTQILFETLTGEKQNMHRAITSSNLVWLEIYRKHYNDKNIDKWLEQFRPLKHSRIGGDATLLYAHE